MRRSFVKRICILMKKVVPWSQPEVNRMVARVKEVGLNSIIEIIKLKIIIIIIIIKVITNNTGVRFNGSEI